MECPNCHHRNSATANYCEHCGASLAAAAAAASSNETAPIAGAAQSQESNGPMSATTFVGATTTETPPPPTPTEAAPQAPPVFTDPSPPPAAGPAIAGAGESGAYDAPPANWVDLRRPVEPPPGWAGSAAPAVPAAVGGEESRRWAIGAHVSAIVGGFLGGIPAFLGPLVVWLLRKDEDGFAAGHARAALNFNLSMLAYAAALVVFSFITFGVGLLLAAPAGAVLGVLWLVFSIMGAIRASNDQPFRYPLSIPFVK